MGVRLAGMPRQMLPVAIMGGTSFPDALFSHEDLLNANPHPGSMAEHFGASECHENVGMRFPADHFMGCRLCLFFLRDYL